MYGSVDLCYFILISLCLEGSTLKLYIILIIEVRLCLACVVGLWDGKCST
jgi:hypothetical protein